MITTTTDYKLSMELAAFAVNRPDLVPAGDTDDTRHLARSLVNLMNFHRDYPMDMDGPGVDWLAELAHEAVRYIAELPLKQVLTYYDLPDVQEVLSDIVSDAIPMDEREMLILAAHMPSWATESFENTFVGMASEILYTFGSEFIGSLFSEVGTGLREWFTYRYGDEYVTAFAMNLASDWEGSLSELVETVEAAALAPVAV